MTATPRASRARHDRSWILLGAAVLAVGLGPATGAAQATAAPTTSEATRATAGASTRSGVERVTQRADNAGAAVVKPAGSASPGTVRPVDGTRDQPNRPPDDTARGAARQTADDAPPQAAAPDAPRHGGIQPDPRANPPDAVAGVAPPASAAGYANLEAALDLMRNRPKAVDSAGTSPAAASLGRAPRPPVPPGDREQKDQRAQLGRVLPAPVGQGW